MQSRTITVSNKLGVHARPAGLITKTFDIDVFYNRVTIDAKSILAVMTMAAKCGDEITIITNGRNDKEALEAIVALFQSKFGEDE